MSQDTRKKNLNNQKANLSESFQLSSSRDTLLKQQHILSVVRKNPKIHFRAIFENAAIGITLADMEGHPIKVNSTFEKMIGYSKQELRKMVFLDFTHPDDINKDSKLFEKMKNGKLESYNLEKRYLRKNGQVIWVHLTVSSIKGARGKPKFTIGVIMDITEHKIIEEKLNMQRTLLESGKEAAIDGILAVSPEGKIISYNQRFLKIWGIPREIIRIQSDKAALRYVKNKVVNYQDFIKKVNYLYKHPNEKSRDEISLHDGRVLDRYSAPISSGKTVNYGRVWFFRDITDKKHEEKRREHFLGIASHELKTPLTSIKGFTQLLKKSFEKQKDQKTLFFLSKIESQTDKVVKLINDLLSVTRIRAGKLEFYDELFNINDLVKEIVENYKPTAYHKILIIGKTNTKIFADRTRIGEVISNMINNAIKYSPKTDRIIVEIKNGSCTSISVQDFGIGIPRAIQSKIFDSYFSLANKDSGEIAGLGLGLYISKKIIKHYKGKIWVKSTQGKGSTFSFKIPCKKPTNKTAKQKHYKVPSFETIPLLS